MSVGPKVHLGTVGCFYERMDFEGYQGWLTDAATDTVYKIRGVRNDSNPLKKGDAVYFFLSGKIAHNVYCQ